MSELIVPSSERSSRVSLSLSSARRGALSAFAANGLAFKHAPADGNSCLHAITRSLGLLPRAQWTSGTLSRWMRIVRAHLARYCGSQASADYLLSDQPFDTDRALILTRLWNIQTFIYPCAENPPGTVGFWPPSEYPQEILDDARVAVHIVGWSDLGIFDYVVPSTILHYPHVCQIEASDLSFFEGSVQAHDLFDRFMETWLRFLFKEPPPHQECHTYASMAAFRTDFPLASWFDGVDLRFRNSTNTCDASSDEFFVSPAFVVESDLRSGALVSSRNSGSSGHPSSRCV